MIKSELQKVIVILGQTATGKSEMAVQIAKEMDGEVISADSRQVYKELNLGSGKITKGEMQGIPHHLLNVANPRRKFTVAEYQKLGQIKIKEIIARGKIPIICGGTGFYIDALIKGTHFPDVPPNHKIRKQLSKKTPEQLFKILKGLDKRRATNIDPKNKVRLIRAIEIAKALGKVPAFSEKKPQYKFLKIGLHLPHEELKKRIEKRLLLRTKAGMVAEVKNLHEGGISWKRLEELGLEYRYVALYLQKKISKIEMIEKLKTEIYHFAKRQMGWFKRDKEVIWINAGDENLEWNTIETMILKWNSVFEGFNLVT